jgi:hypothetical protein
MESARDRLTSIGAIFAKRFEARLKFLLGHRHVIEREEFLFAGSTDESAGVDPVKFVGVGILGRLETMGAGQHVHLSQCGAVRIGLCMERSCVLTMYQTTRPSKPRLFTIEHLFVRDECSKGSLSKR